jgi:hypothetical protein
VWGVTTRNREQNFAMNLLMDPDRLRHPDRHRRHRQDADGAGSGLTRCWTTAATPRSS